MSTPPRGISRRDLCLIAASIGVVVIVVMAGITYLGQRDDEGSTIVPEVGSYLQWSVVSMMNATLADTDHWNYTPSFYLHNDIRLARTTLADKNDTVFTLAYSHLIWERLGQEDLDPINNGTFPELSDIGTDVVGIETKWYGYSYDPASFPNYSYVEHPSQGIMTRWGYLNCAHHSLSIEWTFSNTTGEHTLNESIDWWLYRGILIKRCITYTEDDVPLKNINSFVFLTDTNISAITDH